MNILAFTILFNKLIILRKLGFSQDNIRRNFSNQSISWNKLRKGDGTTNNDLDILY